MKVASRRPQTKLSGLRPKALLKHGTWLSEKGNDFPRDLNKISGEMAWYTLPCETSLYLGRECDRVFPYSDFHVLENQRPLAARHVLGGWISKFTLEASDLCPSPQDGQEYSGIYFSQPSPLRYDPKGEGVD